MNEAVPIQALENPPSEIKLCGKVYHFKEPVKIKATTILADAYAIIRKAGLFRAMDMDSFQKSGAENWKEIGREIQWNLDENLLIASENSMRSLPEIIQFLFNTVPIPEEDRSRIENEFDMAETLQAFQQVVERLQAPFVGGGGNSEAGRTKK